MVERPLLDEARAARRSIAAADVGEKRPIPEPAASVLLLTGIGTILVGLLARQRLLRHRA